MALKNTVAIIGACSTIGTLVAKSIAADYRLLLMDEAQSELVTLQGNIEEAQQDAEVDILNCCKDASWEADIIVVANEGTGLHELAVKMKEVSTCKIVLHFTTAESGIDVLQHLLPHAKVATILISEPFDDTNASAFIHGLDNEAIDIAKMMVAAISCAPGTLTAV
jgi:hypothetical protein